MNGIGIKDAEAFKKLYEDDPGLAIGLLFENVADIKSKCACRLETCRIERKKDRAKNIAVQSGSGFFGGVAAAWVYIKTALGG